jgi:Beta-lactamase
MIMKEDDRTRGGRGTEEGTVLFKPLPPPGLLPYYLDVPTFQVALDTALKNNTVVGYVAQLRQHGQALFTNTWQYARRPQEKQNGSEPWTPTVQMHVASVSKLMTAMAMMVLFRDHNISPDAEFFSAGPLGERALHRKHHLPEPVPAHQWSLDAADSRQLPEHTIGDRRRCQ